MDRYLAELKIPQSVFVKTVTPGAVTYALNTPAQDTTTLYLRYRPELGIEDEAVGLPTRSGRLKQVVTTSRKEIVLAMLQHGRTVVFDGRACTLEALKDQVGIRQNTVAWAENLEWGWPEGGPAKWNQAYWDRGNLRPGRSLPAAMTDVFLNRSKYEVGCYTATKFVMIQGVLDYYSRVKKDPARAAEVERRLRHDGDVLVGIEAGRMWSFESDFDLADMARPGKLLKTQYGVAAGNFVPGDWAYFLNSDPVSYEKTGYEGSNAVYLGRNRFNDHYNDNDHGYTYHQKLNMIFQWRHGVFSRARDFAKIQPLTGDDYNRLERTPSEGGFLLDLRTGPYFFGFEDLPELPAAAQ